MGSLGSGGFGLPVTRTCKPLLLLACRYLVPLCPSSAHSRHTSCETLAAPLSDPGNGPVAVAMQLVGDLGKAGKGSQPMAQAANSTKQMAGLLYEISGR